MSSAHIKKSLERSLKVIEEVSKDDKIIKMLEKISIATIDTYRKDGKSMFMGNGGSAADAQHFSAEFVSKFNFDRPGLASISLSTDTSVLTAIANDYGYENLFSRQIQALGKCDDILFAFSTSGTSKNVINGLKEARRKNIKTVSFIGSNDLEQMSELSDYCIKVPSKVVSIIQECHGILGHIVCDYVEREIFGNKPD